MFVQTDNNFSVDHIAILSAWFSRLLVLNFIFYYISHSFGIYLFSIYITNSMFYKMDIIAKSMDKFAK